MFYVCMINPKKFIEKKKNTEREREREWGQTHEPALPRERCKYARKE
jgi:hypothetical protein